MGHDENDTPREPMDCRSMMQQMLERMCAANDCDPAAMCQGMMASRGAAKDTDAPPAAEASTSSGEQARGAEQEVPGGCCGPRSRGAAKRA